jgi:hypothetical protein
MEEYGVKITYIKGSENIAADVLSLYPTTNDPEVEKPIPTQSELSKVFATNNNIPDSSGCLSVVVSNPERGAATGSLNC